MTASREIGEFRGGMPFLGGRLWLDLLNTTPVVNGERRDLIDTPSGLAAWLEAAGLQAPGEDLRLFREELRSTVEILRDGGALPPALVDTINARLAGMTRRLRIESGVDGVRLVETLEPGLSGASGAIAEDFARFLADHEGKRLKHCANTACTMVFYDTGKNNARRWCTMSLCGNRHKVARFRSRVGIPAAG